MLSTRPTQRYRSAFTLLELLMVMVIIGILASLSTVVMLGVTEQAERDATKATIRKINALMRDRIEAYDRAYKGDTRRRYVRATVNALKSNTTVGDVFDYALATPDRADAAILVLARKFGFAYFFPQRMEDVTPFDGQTQIAGMSDVVYARIAAPTARTQLIAEGTPSPSDSDILIRATANWASHDPDTESAELLYFALLHSATFGASPLDADQFRASEVRDTDEDGLPEFVDRWGQPLRFYRWPTRLVDPDQNQAVSVTERQVAVSQLRSLPPPPYLAGNQNLALVDPDDPAGLISSMEATYIAQGVSTYFDSALHTRDTFHSPLIVSAGVDEEMGMFEPHDTVNGGNLANWNNVDTVKDAMYDNLSNRSGRAGGAR